MKRITAIILVALMLLSLTACGGSSNTETETTPDAAPEPSQAVEDIQQADTTQESDSTEKSGYTETLHIPLRDIYVSYEQGLREYKAAATTLVYDTNDALVGLTYDFDRVYTGGVDGVAQFFADEFPEKAASSSVGNINSSINILTSEACTVNGFDSVRFTGTCSNDGEWDCHVYGYSFIINGTAFAIIGLVSHRAQDPELIATIDARVDAMAATVRTEK